MLTICVWRDMDSTDTCCDVHVDISGRTTKVAFFQGFLSCFFSGTSNNGCTEVVRELKSEAGKLLGKNL